MVGHMIPGTWIIQEEGKPLPEARIPDPAKIAGTNDENILRRIDELQVICQGRFAQARDEVSHADRELSDMYHFIEFSNCNAAQGYQAYKALKDVLTHRREAKQEVETLQNLNNVIETTLKIAAKKVPNKTYKPRVFENMFKK